jgi:CheY-like chemotaxis protein
VAAGKLIHDEIVITRSLHLATCSPLIGIAGMRPILLATDHSSDVYHFWLYHKQCGILNPVEVLSDGRDVVTYLEVCPLHRTIPALLVASLKMPSMGGLQLLEHLTTKRQTDFPTILLIDHQDHDPPLVASAFRLGVDSFLRRPLLKKDFCQVMSRFENLTMGSCPGIDTSPEPTRRLSSERIVS